MTKTQLELLKAYIQAVITDRFDTGDSSDEGLISRISLHQAEAALDASVDEEEGLYDNHDE